MTISPSFSASLRIRLDDLPGTDINVRNETIKRRLDLQGLFLRPIFRDFGLFGLLQLLKLELVFFQHQALGSLIKLLLKLVVFVDDRSQCLPAFSRQELVTTILVLIGVVELGQFSFKFYTQQFLHQRPLFFVQLPQPGLQFRVVRTVGPAVARAPEGRGRMLATQGGSFFGVELGDVRYDDVADGLFRATDGKRCRPYSEGQAVRAKTPSGYVYPDASVACDPQFTRHPERGIDILTNPIVIVEVTSPDSKLRDHNAKSEAYRINETLTDYIIIESDTIFVTHHQRNSGEWQKIAYSGMGDIIKTTLQVELTLADLYVGAEFK